MAGEHLLKGDGVGHLKSRIALASDTAAAVLGGGTLVWA